MAAEARGHFEGDAGLAGGLADVGAAGDEGQFEGAGGFAHEAFVGVGGGAAQLVVEMGDG